MTNIKGLLALTLLALLVFEALAFGRGYGYNYGRYKGKHNGRKCRDDRDCTRGSFCVKENCDDKFGECGRVTTMCNEIYNPVCGCDGRTYPNECAAMGEGVNVDFLGRCEKECHCNSDCKSTEYCQKDTSDCRGKGVCAPRPNRTECPVEFAAVCGCDGVTYSGTCFAAANGTSVAYVGNCVFFEQCGGPQPPSPPTPAPPKACRSNADCNRNEFCAKEVGECNQSFDLGVCTKTPDFCAMIYQPVCGCNGKTYGNECEAHTQRQNIAYSGQCQPATEYDF